MSSKAKKEKDLKDEELEVEETEDDSKVDDSKDEKSEAEEAKDEETKEEESKAEEKDKETFESKYLRMTADFQNFKRRVDKEKSDIHAFANERFAKDLLEVLDNFERAIEQDKTENVDEQYVKGMELILMQLRDVLKKNGVEEIEALGVEFDPNFHHAVAMESSDKYDKGVVMDVMQKGYKIKDRVIRPSMVRVAE